MPSHVTWWTKKFLSNLWQLISHSWSLCCQQSLLSSTRQWLAKFTTSSNQALSYTSETMVDMIWRSSDLHLKKCPSFRKTSTFEMTKHAPTTFSRNKSKTFSATLSEQRVPSQVSSALSAKTITVWWKTEKTTRQCTVYGYKQSLESQTIQILGKQKKKKLKSIQQLKWSLKKDRRQTSRGKLWTNFSD